MGCRAETPAALQNLCNVLENLFEVELKFTIVTSFSVGWWSVLGMLLVLLETW